VFTLFGLRIIQRKGLKLHKDLEFSGLVQNVFIYPMANFKKILLFRFYLIKSQGMHGLLWQLRKMTLKLMNYD